MIREYRVLYFMCSDYKCILNEFTRYDAENEYDSGTAAAYRRIIQKLRKELRGDKP